MTHQHTKPRYHFS